ncbi:MAG: DUF6418 domain-containing protein [Sphingomonadaceae bacterium]
MTRHGTARTAHHRHPPSMAVARQDSLNPLLQGMMIVMSILLVWLLSALFTSPLWSIVSLVNFLWLGLFLFRVAPIATILMLPFLVTRSSAVVALIFIEFGADMPEVAAVGTAGTHTASYVFYTAIMFGVCAMLFDLVYRSTKLSQPGQLTRLFDSWAPLIVSGIIAVVGLVMLVLIARGLISGFPLLAGIDRFAFRRFAADPITLNALNYKFVIAYMLGFAVFCAPVVRFLKTIAAVQAALLVVLYFLFADKFFTQLAAMSAFFAPYLIIHRERVSRNLLGFGVGSLIAFSVVSSVTWWIYSQGGTISNAATIDRLSGRIVGQGQLWYLQSQIGAPMLNWDRHLVNTSLSALTVKEMEPFAQRQSIGPAYFSNKHAPDALRASLDRNFGTVSYTMAAEALGLVAFGWIGLGLLMVACGLIIAAGNLLIARAVLQRLPISVGFAAYILVQTQVTLNQGALWVLFSIFSLKWLSVIAFVEFLLIILVMSQRDPAPRYRRVQRRR